MIVKPDASTSLTAPTPVGRGLAARPAVALAGLAAAALAVRLYGLERLSFWWDEAYSYWFASQPLASLWHFVPTFELHPPLYYSMLKGVLAFGSDEATLRSLSVAAGVLTVPFAYALGRSVAAGEAGRRIGLITAALFALSPLHVEFAQQARPYALMTMAMTLALAAAAWLVANPAAAAAPWLGLGSFRRRQTDPGPAHALLAWLAAVEGAALSLWLHNASALFVAGLGLAALYAAGAAGWRRGFLGNLAIAAATILALWLPHASGFFVQSAHLSEAYWQQRLQFSNVVEPLAQMLEVKHLLPLTAAPLIVVFVWLGAKRMVADGKRALVVLLLGVPAFAYTALLVASLLVESMLVPRALIWLNVPLFAVIGAAIAGLSRAAWRAAAVVGLLGLSALGCVKYHTEYLREPWREVAATIAELASADDVVIAVPGSGELSLDYYLRPLRPDLRIVPFPARFPTVGVARDYPAGIRGVPGVIATDGALIEREVAGARAVWLVARALFVFDSGDVVLTTLRSVRTETDRWPINRYTDLYRFE